MNYIVTSKQLLESTVINNTFDTMNSNDFVSLDMAVKYAMEAYKAYKKINVLVIGYEVEDPQKISNRLIINMDSVKIYDEEKIKGLYSLL